MSSLTQIELPNGTTYDIEDAKKKGVYVVKGTHTTATVAWTGAIDVDALYDGLTIAYYLPISATSGSTQVTLNLTLSGGTTTGAINCYYNASKLTRSYYPAGSNIIMTYWSAGSISISGTATTDNRWIAGADYNANTWRAIQVDGTQLLSTSTSSGALNLVSGTNISVSGSGNDVTISATGTGSIATMTDVQLTSPTDNDLLVYDSSLGSGKLWKNAKKIVTCTQAEFDTWTANNSFPYTDCKYIITDSNNLNVTTADIPYDSTNTASVKDKLDTDRFYDYGTVTTISGTDSSIGTWMKANFKPNDWCQVRIRPTDDSGFYGSSEVCIMYNLYSTNYGVAICTSDNTNKEAMRIGRLAGGIWYFTALATTYQITPMGDNRSVATTPNDYRNKLVFQGLKQNSSIGSPTSGTTYSYLVGLCGWSDRSCGGAWEIAFNDKGIFIRREGTTQNTWASWVALYSG